MRFIIVPGWRDSGPGHWQSLWAGRLPHAVRVQQDDWITPSRKAWVASLAQTILLQREPVVIVAHSLAASPPRTCRPTPAPPSGVPCWWRRPTPNAVLS